MKRELGVMSAGIVMTTIFSACSAQSGTPGTARNIAAKSAAVSGGVRRKAFSDPSATSSGYVAATFDIYQVPDDSLQTPDQIEVLPQGQTPPPDANGNAAQPVPSAMIAFPDGSIQIAGSDGSFTPAESSYVAANAADIEANPADAPYVTVSDPAGQDQPLYFQLQAGSLTGPEPGGGGRAAQNVYVHILDRTSGGGAAGLSALAVLPQTAGTRDGSLVPLSLTALDAAGHAIAPVGAVTWTQPAAGRIVPVGDGSSAVYHAPRSGSGIDRFTAAITPPGSPRAFVAGGAVAYEGALATITGTLAQAGSAAPEGARLGFVQSTGLPAAIFRPFVWTAANVGDGFRARVPAGVPLAPTIALGAPNPGTFAALAPDGTSTFTAPGGGASGEIFSLPAKPLPFPAPSAQPIPAVATLVRDASLATVVPREIGLFDLASGLQTILANPFAPARGSVPSGAYAGWAFEWQNVGGAPSLVLVESGHGAPGTASATITPFGDWATFGFSRYRSATPLSLASPLVAAQPGSLLTSGGAWSQGDDDAGTFGASLEIDLYDVLDQTPGSPIATERGTYTALSDGGARYSDMAIFDANGRRLWTFDAVRARASEAAHAPAAPSRTATLSGRFTRFYPNSTGRSTAKSFTLRGDADTNGATTIAFARNDAPNIEVDFRVQDGIGGELVRDGHLFSGGVPFATFTANGDGFVDAVVGADAGAGYPGVPLDFPL